LDGVINGVLGFAFGCVMPKRGLMGSLSFADQDEEEKEESSASTTSTAGGKVWLYHPVLFFLSYDCNCNVFNTMPWPL